MSILSRLEQLALDKAAIKDAIERKNPKIPPTGDLAQWPTSIESIPRVAEWVKPSGWPDIKSILDSDTHDYTYKVIVLYDARIAPDTWSLTDGGAQLYVCSDGYEGVGASHTWDTTKDIEDSAGGLYRWVIMLSNSAFVHFMPTTGGTTYLKAFWIYAPDADFVISRSYPFLAQTTLQSLTVGNVSQPSTSHYRLFSNLNSIQQLKAKSVSVKRCDEMFSGAYSLKSIDIGELDTSAATNMNSMFNNCYSLVSIPYFDASSAVTMITMFANCHSLVSIPPIDTSSATTMNQMFSDCASLTTLPQMDTSSATSMQSMFNGCRRLRDLPSGFTIPDGCFVDRIYQWCSSLRKPASRMVAGASNTSVNFYEAQSLDSMGDYVDLRNVTSYSNIFSANSFIKVPTTLLLSSSLNISWTTYQEKYKDRFAHFTDGVIDDGLVYNLNTVSNLTLTVGSTMKSFFTATEISAIEALASSKGWTISW